MNAVEETDKIEKLEKSLEMLDKAIEKNNQSEFNALTDVLDTDSNFDFEKDDDEEKNAIQASETPDNKDNKPMPPIRAKLTLPPANNHLKPLSSAQSNASRPSLGQSLIPSKLNSGKSNSRQRTGAGGGGGFGGSITTLSSSNARSSLPSKRREGEVPSSKHTTASAADTAAEKLEALAKTFEYDYEEDSDRDDDEDSDDKKYGKMDEEDDAASDEEENQNNGQDEYVSYLDTKCELVEMLEMDEEYEDDDDDLQSPQPPSKAVVSII